MAFSFKSMLASVIPAGTYKVKVDNIQFRKLPDGTSTKDIAVTYRIMEGPMANRTIQDTIFEKSFEFRLMNFVTACKLDVNKEFTTQDEVLQYGIRSAKDKIMNIEVTIRPYNGKEYNNVSKWTPLAESSTTSEEVLDAFDVDTDEKPTVTQDATAVNAPGTYQAVEGPSTDVVDDDLPF